MSPPKVFISATAAGLRSVREAVTEALVSIGCLPVEVASFESDQAIVAGVLREKIESCQAFVHIAGTRYGPEPDPATVPAGTPRRSYAQMEYHIGCEVKEQRGEEDFWIYVFVCPEDFPYDPVAGIEISEKWALQDAHRNQLPKSPYFCGSPESAEDMRVWALSLSKQFPPPPPPPPPEEPPPALPNAEGAEPAAEVASEGAGMPLPADVASDEPRRSRVPLVLGVLALTGVIVLVAAFLMLRHFGLLDGRFAWMPKAESKAIPTAKSDDFVAVEPEPKPAAPLPKAKVVETPPAVTPPAPAPAAPAPAVVAEKPPLPPSPSAPALPSPASKPPSSPLQANEINLVRRAALAADPARKMSVAEIGKLYVDQPLYNGKTFTREDVVRQVDQFRRSWDVQALDILEGPTVTSGGESNHVTVKVKTRFVGLRKTSIQASTVIMTSEYGVLLGADGTPLIESVRELARE